MIEGDGQDGGDKYAPIAVKGEKCEGAKDVEMRFNAAAREVNEEGRHQHLGDGDGVARRRSPGPSGGDDGRVEREDPAEKEGRPHVEMHGEVRTGPGAGRDDEGEDEARKPFKGEETDKKAIDEAEVFAASLVKEGARAGGQSGLGLFGNGTRNGTRGVARRLCREVCGNRAGDRRSGVGQGGSPTGRVRGG